MRTIATVLFLLLTSPLFAQRECATQSYIESRKSNPQAAARIAKADAFMQQQQAARTLNGAKENGSSISTIIRIPVVVHVLYNTPTQNISEAQIRSQLEVLNRDFRKKNADTASIPPQFRHLAADSEIEFVLATADPLGRPTNGIVRKETTVKDWKADDAIKFSNRGGSDAWDSHQYLNIWVGNLFRLLGYASVPGCEPAIDGVVINASAFGTINVAAPYHLGRTTVHEVGHWLGLRHIWGDAACGDDLVEDTPAQGNFTAGCPTGFRTTCNNGPLGDMYMNYMDFTNDACLNLFTLGQKDRMRSVFAEGGPRTNLLASKGLKEPWTTEAPIPVETNPGRLLFYPNPVTDQLGLNFNNDNSWMGKDVQLINANGLVVQKIRITATVQKVATANLRPGIYFIRGENGATKLFEKLMKL